MSPGAQGGDVMGAWAGGEGPDAVNAGELVRKARLSNREGTDKTVSGGLDSHEPVEKLDELSALACVEPGQPGSGVIVHGFFDATKAFLAGSGEVDEHAPAVERVAAAVDQRVRSEQVDHPGGGRARKASQPSNFAHGATLSVLEQAQHLPMLASDAHVLQDGIETIYQEPVEVP